MKTKRCKSKKYPERSCGLEKPLDQFKGTASLCVECQKKYQKQWYEDNKEDILKEAAQYRAEHTNEIKEKDKRYRENNKDKLKEKDKQYYENNKEIITLNAKNWYRNNKEKKKEYDKQYREDNKKIRNAAVKERRENDPSFKLRVYLSRDIGRALKSHSSSKQGKSITQYLPYTDEQLRLHIENQFEPWMNWDNHGKYVPETWDDDNSDTWTWQLDHIIPQSDFRYTSMEDEGFKKCWALENLRPLGAKQNVLDGVGRKRHIIK